MASKFYLVGDLKPCPFCGGKAQIRRGKTADVGCKPCRLYMFINWADDEDQMIENAMQAWNHRKRTR